MHSYWINTMRGNLNIFFMFRCHNRYQIAWCPNINMIISTFIFTNTCFILLISRPIFHPGSVCSNIMNITCPTTGNGWVTRSISVNTQIISYPGCPRLWLCLLVLEFAWYDAFNPHWRSLLLLVGKEII